MQSGDITSPPVRPAGPSTEAVIWAAAPFRRRASRGASLARALSIDLSVTAGLVGGLMFVASQVG